MDLILPVMEFSMFQAHLDSEYWLLTPNSQFTIEKFKSELYHLFEENEKTVILDISGLVAMKETDVRHLEKAWEVCEEVDKTLVLLVNSEMETSTLTETDLLFAPTLDECIALVRMDALEREIDLDNFE